MAKRRMVKQEEEKASEEPVFKMPEFDETEFLQTENRNAKMIYITLSVGLVAGIVSFALMRSLHLLGTDLKFTAPIAVPILFLPLVWYLLKRFGIDPLKLDWKKYLENGFMYVVLWLAIWLVTMNPPFSDFSDPSVSAPVVQVMRDDGNRTTVFDTIEPLQLGSSMSVYFLVTDNTGIDSVDIEVTLTVDGDDSVLSEGGIYNLTKGKAEGKDPLALNETEADEIGDVEGWHGSDMAGWDGDVYFVRFGDLSSLDDDGSLTFEVVADDGKGNERTYVFEVPFVA